MCTQRVDVLPTQRVNVRLRRSQPTQCGSHGFCLFNNVAIAAAYARCVHRTKIRKVAIVDFDVHHGNGTEALVRNLSPSVQEESFQTPFAKGTVSTPMYKPWLDSSDPSNVFFASIHGYGRKVPDIEVGPQTAWFYPASGETSRLSAATKRKSDRVPGVAVDPAAAAHDAAKEGEPLIYNVRVDRRGRCCRTACTLDRGAGAPGNEERA